MAVDVRRLRAEILLGGCLALAACGGGSGGRNATATPTRASPTNTATRTATPTAATPTTIPASFTPTPTPTEPMDVPDFTPTPDAASPTPTLAPTDTAMPTLTPTEVPTEVPTSGPVITAFGIADASGALILPTGPPGDPRTFQTQFGSGFIIYVEGRPGPSGLDVGKSTFNRSPFDPRIRPDIQIASSRDLGDGSVDSCDNSAPDLGGVPALDPADFSVTQEISDTVNDFSCRFRAFDRSVFPCTQDTSANFAFVDPNTTVQFCTLVSDAIRFPPGNTLLTVRLRDTGGAVGATAAIMIQVAQ